MSPCVRVFACDVVEFWGCNCLFLLVRRGSEGRGESGREGKQGDNKEGTGWVVDVAKVVNLGAVVRVLLLLLLILSAASAAATAYHCFQHY